MNRNNGYFLEQLIEITVEIYKNEKIALFHKRNINDFFKLKKLNINNNKIQNYSGCDFLGIYNGNYITIEAKECKGNELKLKNISFKQLNEMELSTQLKGYSFIIIYFTDYEKYFLIDYTKITEIKKSKINIKEIQEIGYEIFIVIPFKLDFIKEINNIINKSY